MKIYKHTKSLKEQYKEHPHAFLIESAIDNVLFLTVFLLEPFGS